MTKLGDEVRESERWDLQILRIEMDKNNYRAPICCSKYVNYVTFFFNYVTNRWSKYRNSCYAPK
jgi:hypothetical protein